MFAVPVERESLLELRVAWLVNALVTRRGAPTSNGGSKDYPLRGKEGILG